MLIGTFLLSCISQFMIFSRDTVNEISLKQKNLDISNSRDIHSTKILFMLDFSLHQPIRSKDNHPSYTAIYFIKLYMSYKDLTVHKINSRLILESKQQYLLYLIIGCLCIWWIFPIFFFERIRLQIYTPKPLQPLYMLGKEQYLNSLNLLFFFIRIKKYMYSQGVPCFHKQTIYHTVLFL